MRLSLRHLRRLANTVEGAVVTPWLSKPFIHPYIPNSVPATKQAMLAELGLEQRRGDLRRDPRAPALQGPAEHTRADPRRVRPRASRDGAPEQERLVAGVPQLLRRRLLAALRAGGRRRGHQPGGVPERLLRRRLLRPRQVPGALRVQQPARRAARSRRRRQSHLRLGRRGRPLVPHGEPHHGSQARARAAHHEPDAPGGGAHPLPAGGDAHAHRHRARGLRSAHGPHGPRGPRAARSPTTSPPCTTRTPATWAS